MEKITEQQIAEGLGRGCTQAWAGLYDAYAGRIWQNVARLMGSDSPGVADVVQNTFLAAGRSGRGFDPRRGCLWAWLWGIARRQVALHYRNLGRSDQLSLARRWWALMDGRGGDWITGRVDAPEEVLASRELATLVRHALAQLPGEYQTLLMGKYMDGASAQQLAGMTDSSSSAVRSKLARARRAFRKEFLQIADWHVADNEVPR